MNCTRDFRSVSRPVVSRGFLIKRTGVSSPDGLFSSTLWCFRAWAQIMQIKFKYQLCHLHAGDLGHTDPMSLNPSFLICKLKVTVGILEDYGEIQ